jgi:hypothetical protein
VATLRGIIERTERRAAGRASDARPRAEAAPDPATHAGSEDASLTPELLDAVAELRARLPGGEHMAPEPEAVVRAASHLLRGRSYRLARLVAGRDSGPRALARLPLKLWRELRKT